MTILKEIWLDIPGYESLYKVSNRGNVKSLPRWINNRWLGKNGLLKFIHNKDYSVVGLSKNGIQVQKQVHALVMLAFVGPYPKGLEIRHLDGVRANNDLSNLVYGTSSENNQDTILHGKKVGENCGRAKLTNSKVRKIKKLFKTTSLSNTDIGRLYNVTAITIGRIKRGQTWATII